MICVDLSDAGLFKSLIEIEHGNLYLDLHNDFNCYTASVIIEKGCIEIRFVSSTKDAAVNHFKYVFSEVDVVKTNLIFNEHFKESLTIDNFYRGRFEKAGGLFEYSKSEQGYFYLEFYEDYYLELFAKQVNAVID